MSDTKPKITVEMTPSTLAVWARIVQVVKEFPFFRTILSDPAARQARRSDCNSCRSTRTTVPSPAKTTQTVNQIKAAFLDLPHAKQVKLLQWIQADEVIVAGYDFKGRYYKKIITKNEE